VGESPASEPLFLRIRPFDASRPEGIGTVGPSAHDVAAARAAREAVWERAERRARIAIASVCTGCLPPAAPTAHSDVRNASAGTPPGTEEPPAPPTQAAHLASSPADSR